MVDIISFKIQMCSSLYMSLAGQRKYCVPLNTIAYATLKRFILQKIGKTWRDHKSRMKKQHYIPDSRNKARVKNNGPRGCISQDWDILVDHWYTDDAVIESENNKEHHSKQDDVHIDGSCNYVVHAAKKAKTDGRPVERSVLYQILHTRKDGSAVNPVVKAKMVSNFSIVLGCKQNRNSMIIVINFDVSQYAFLFIVGLFDC
ncbi:hypothetical protein SO802_023189 [Lithocarpus litseifolius]|uniref:Transposase n=1 Tax=Lithocarpus litseifolius TaxID=425828 RepID=A0AAW2C5K0_9ROSI